jgi:hypothetical protein
VGPLRRLRLEESLGERGRGCLDLDQVGHADIRVTGEPPRRA